MKAYPWVSNDAKLERARVALGPEASEDQIKAKYESFGGLVLNVEPVSPAKAEEQAGDDEAPKKTKKK